jgi:galactoside O-acetyltransferase
VRIGNHVHIAAGVMIFGSEGCEIGDFAGLSSRVAIYSASDDYVSGHLTNPTVPDRFRNVSKGKVVLEPHALVGAGSVLLPGVTLHRGAAVGALSLVNRSVPAFQVVLGTPARPIKMRDQVQLERLEREFLDWESRSSPAEP